MHKRMADANTALAQKLSQIQRELKAPKNQTNKFGNYRYRSCEDILEAIKPLLDDAIVVLNDEIVQVGERVYVRATATFTFGDGEGKISVTAYAREPESKKGMDESQITGAASSYARKYALNGLFLIDDSKLEQVRDPDTQRPGNELCTEKQLKAFNMLGADVYGDKWDEMKDRMRLAYKVETTKDINKIDMKKILDKLTKLSEQKQNGENGK